MGQNLQRVRQERGHTQAEASRLLWAAGLPWRRDNVAALESGRRETADLATLICLSIAYEVPLTEWFAGDGEVRLSDYAHTTRAAVRAGLAASFEQLVESVQVSGDAADAALQQLGVTFKWVGAGGQVHSVEADEAVAARLGVPTGRVLRAALALWQRSLTEERDQRVNDKPLDLAPQSRRTYRGHVTRELTDELVAHLKRGENL